MDNNEASFFKNILTLVAFIVLSATSCNVAINHNDNATMESMVEKGAKPLEARCAVKNDQSNVCAILVSK